MVPLILCGHRVSGDGVDLFKLSDCLKKMVDCFRRAHALLLTYFGVGGVYCALVGPQFFCFEVIHWSG